MTSETRTFIDFKDIVAIQYECTHCGTKTAFPVGKIVRQPKTCSNCGQEWFVTDTDTKRQSFANFITWLGNATHASQDLETSGVKLAARLEIHIHKDSLV